MSCSLFFINPFSLIGDESVASASPKLRKRKQTKTAADSEGSEDSEYESDPPQSSKKATVKVTAINIGNLDLYFR